MLELASRYHVTPGAANILLPIDVTNPLTGNKSHNGAQSGVADNGFIKSLTLPHTIAKQFYRLRRQ